MIPTRMSEERRHHQKTLLDALRDTCQKANTSVLYVEARSQQILSAFISEDQLFSTGLTRILTRDSPPTQDVDRVVLLAVIRDQAITELERYWHLFREVFLINLLISGQETKQLIKVSPLRKKLRAFIEISLNFLPFIDSVYFTNAPKKQSQEFENICFEQALATFLISLQKFHQFQLYFKPGSESTVSVLKQRLMQKLETLESHKAKEYSSVSSPKIKVLVLSRKLDELSPMVYSYHFGPISHELGTNQIKSKNISAVNSPLFKVLFPMDIEEAGQFLTNLAQHKAKNQKAKFELHQFQKAKEIIANHYDEHTSPQQIELYIDTLSSVRQFCKRRTYTTALQQTIVNACSENSRKMSGGDVVDFIVEWANVPLEEFKPSQQDYVKIVVLSYMVNNFWFWQRRVINAGLEQHQKDRVLNFCRQSEGRFKSLPEKPQGQDRFDLYRHQPAIVTEVKHWMKDPSEDYVNLPINKSSINRESKLVIAVNGPLGYGQLAMLLRQLRQMNLSCQPLIYCESLSTTKEYLNGLIKRGSLR